MSKLPSVDGKQVVAALEKAGFYLDRISKSSHHIMKKSGHLFNVSVPVHGHANIKRGTLGGILAAAGLTDEEFRALL
jgi:predicted RNA binding protein YcfA (HicA-like mRNA interferase family)